MLILAPMTATPVAADHNYPDDVDGNVTTLRGPVSLYGHLDAPGDVRAARDDGRLVESNVTTVNETVVARFESAWLNRTVADTDGANATERFFAAVNATNASVVVEQTNPTPERLPYRIDLRESDVRVVHDPANATFWLVVDTTDPVLRLDDGDPYGDQSLDRGEELGVVVSVPDSDDTRTLGGRIRVVELEAGVERLDGAAGGEPLYANGGTLGVRATTTALPGENVTVTARDANGTTLDSVATTTRAANGTVRFRANLSVGSLASGERFTVTATACNRTLLERRGVVGAPPAMTNVSAMRYANGSTHVAATVHYPDDGFLKLVDEEDGAWLETRYVPGGERTRVTFVTDSARFGVDERATLVGWWDATGDGEFDSDGLRRDWRWRVDGDILEERAYVGSANPTPTPTVTPTSTDTASPSPHPPSTPSPSPTASPTPTDQPGFGLAAAFAALAGLLAAARRRG